MKIILKNNEYYISLLQDDGGYYYVSFPYGQWSESTKEEKVLTEDAQMVIDSQKTLYDLVKKVQTGAWPMSKEEKAKYYEQHGINEMLAKIKKEATENYNSSEK